MEKKKKTGPDECCRAERQIGYEVRTLNQVIGRLVNSYQSKHAGVDHWLSVPTFRRGCFPERPGSRISDGAFYCFRNPSGNGEERAYYQRIYSKRCQVEASGAYGKGDGISDGNYGEF